MALPDASATALLGCPVRQGETVGAKAAEGEEMNLTHGSLFAGIGGFDLGFERAGIEAKWQVEIDPFCQKVLAKHWPTVKRYGDIRECGKHNLEPVDIISGGFPCQDISRTGFRIGIGGERSGLWSEMFRVVCELRPRFVCVENVAGILDGGAGRVLGDLASCGYDAEWQSLPASAFGAPHIRERIWFIAYPRSKSGDVEGTSLDGQDDAEQGSQSPAWRTQDIFGYKPPMVGRVLERSRKDKWDAQSRMARSSYELPCHMDRLRSIGNSVHSGISEWIGKRIALVENQGVLFQPKAEQFSLEPK